LKATHRLLAVALTILSSAAGSALAGESQPAMRLGQPALAPAGYLEFCRRQPSDCGADPARVLAEVSRAEADRASLLGAPGAPAALASEMAAPQAREASPAAPAMGAALWGLLNRVNAQVNRAITPRTDQATYGVVDYWATPLADGHKLGDCEDYVLEKERALIAAGLPREALSIAAVVTRWGEMHAVLLVNTSQGEFVLDNLTSAVLPWSVAPYDWRKRQAPGEAMRWVMIEAGAAAAR